MAGAAAGAISGAGIVNELIEFLASFPNVQSAIRVAGDGGARITLDIAESEMPAIVRLMLMRGMVLRVTVEPEQVEEQKTQVVTWRERPAKLKK